MTTTRFFSTHHDAVERLNIMHGLAADKRTALVRAYEVLARRALRVLAGRITPLGFAKDLAERYKLANPRGVSKMSLDDVCSHWWPILTEIEAAKVPANAPDIDSK